MLSSTVKLVVAMLNSANTVHSHYLRNYYWKKIDLRIKQWEQCIKKHKKL